MRWKLCKRNGEYPSSDYALGTTPIKEEINTIQKL